MVEHLLCTCPPQKTEERGLELEARRVVRGGGDYFNSSASTSDELLRLIRRQKVRRGCPPTEREKTVKGANFGLGWNES